jgi:hypothetical protein
VSTNDGGPAFPVESASHWQAHGMSLRDYFAAKALQGGALRTGVPMEAHIRAFIAAQCYEMADAMLAAREAP